MELNRCPWATTDLYKEYHDKEWGKPVHDDQKLFEMLILEGMQAGLSWITILNKRENMRKAFDQYDPYIVAQYGPDKEELLLQNPGIIRNKRKIQALAINARAFLEIQKEFESFDKYIWRFVGGSTIVNGWTKIEEVPSKTEVSDAMSKDLKRRGFKFIGSTICYAYMQSIGMVNDHLVSCEQYQNTSHSTIRYIALLRGINVGGNNKISMPALKEAFEQRGLKEVITYINSGNIIFSSELDAQTVRTLCQEIIFETFDLQISVGIIKGTDFIDIINNAPKWWNNTPECKHNLIVVIPPATVEEVLVSVGEAKPEYESVAHYGNAIFWTAPMDTFSKTRWSKVSKNKGAYQAITIRNANTILKMAALVKKI